MKSRPTLRAFLATVPVLGLSSAAWWLTVAVLEDPYGFAEAAWTVRILMAISTLFLALSLLFLSFGLRRGAPRQLGLAGFFRLLGWVAVFVQVVMLTGTGVNYRSHVASLEAMYLSGGDTVFLDTDGTAYFYGEIGPDSVRSMRDTFAETPFTVLHLYSGGGRLDSAREIADFVSDMRIEVHIDSSCESACVLVALSSHRLLARRDAEFGFHQGSSIGGDDSELGRFSGRQATEEMYETFRKSGVPDDILRRGRETASDDMFYVTANRLYGAGIVDGFLD